MSDLLQRADDFAAGFASGFAAGFASGFASGAALGGVPFMAAAAFSGYIRTGWEVDRNSEENELRMQVRAEAERIQAERN